MNLKDVIEILIDYDVRHCEFPHNRLKKNKEDIGMISHDERKIWICSEFTAAMKRRTVIHELCHAHISLRGETDSEEAVKELEDKIYAEIYA